MATPKPKPKDYSAVTGWQPTPSNAIKNITSKTGVEVTEDLKIKFRRATECFLADVLLLDGQPRISEKKARLKKLINGTTKYLALLNDTDDSTLQTINDEPRELLSPVNS